MLEELKLKNFRCFKDFSVDFDKFNVIVGRNNAGKSTIIDALKLVSNVRRYAPYRKYFYLEREDARVCYIEERDIPFSQINFRYNYLDEDVVIYSKFSDNTEIKIVFPIEDRPYACFTMGGQNIYDKKTLLNNFKFSMGIIPPVGTFEDSESLGDKDYVSSIFVSHLTARHFRNIWHFHKDGFEDFKELIEKTWPDYTIQLPEFNLMDNRVDMFFKENSITREIFWAGHGFQIWLQLMTFLVKLGRMDTLILDEPDIYLHSDMQKKLVSICKERSNQVIIATHAVDIIEEVEPEEIISIDKKSKKSRNLSNIDEVQSCITQLGSLQNLKLIHFIRGKSCLFLEGDDFRILKPLARKLNIISFANEDGFSVVPIEGFHNWERLTHVDWVFKNTFGERVKCYVLLDRDYYTKCEIDEIIEKVEKKGVKIHVWDRKEIENYLIVKVALYRMFNNRFSKRYVNVEIPISESSFNKRIDLIFEELKDVVQAQIIARRITNRPDRSIDTSTIISQVLKEFQKNWKDSVYRMKVIPGKEFFARLNTWLNGEYHVTIPIGYAINSLRTDEIDSEISEVIKEFIQLVNSK